MGYKWRMSDRRTWRIRGASGFRRKEPWKDLLDCRPDSILKECEQQQFTDRTQWARGHQGMMACGSVIQWYSLPIHFVCSLLQPAKDECRYAGHTGAKNEVQRPEQSSWFRRKQKCFLSLLLWRFDFSNRHSTHVKFTPRYRSIKLEKKIQFKCEIDKISMLNR